MDNTVEEGLSYKVRDEKVTSACMRSGLNSMDNLHAFWVISDGQGLAQRQNLG